MRLLADWRTWVGYRHATNGHTVTEASEFVSYIRVDHADLLSFESDESKLDVVGQWLRNSGLINDERPEIAKPH